jgi:UDP-glucose 4-epimerase
MKVRTGVCSLKRNAVLVTGANGFLGAALCQALSAVMQVSGAIRPLSVPRKGSAWKTVSGELSASFNWMGALSGVSSVVHCAARVHVVRESLADPLAAFRAVNVDGTLSLARQAAEAGVRRFIFISSIKVNGERSLLGSPFMADQTPAPDDFYGVSKFEAEEGLRALSRETGMEVVIIRPPLVYGPGVKANFLAMIRWLHLGVPLPLGGVTENRRSLVFLDNLVDLIVTCIDHPKAANQKFLVSDDEDMSTAELLQRMGIALCRPAKLISVPPQLLVFGAKLIGRPGIAQRLCGSLQVDISKTKELLGWSPPVRVDSALQKTAEHWLKTQSARFS